MVKFINFAVTLTVLLMGTHALTQESADEIREELLKAKIIPEAIDDFDVLTKMKITYDEAVTLELGMTIKPEETLVVPYVWIEEPSEDTEYTLAMVNLDSHGPLVRHWIATNVKGNDKRGTAFSNQSPQHQYTTYKGPTPPPGPKTHRVAFVLFEQGLKNHTFTPVIDSTSLRNRAFFDLKKFAEENDLTPVSATYFYTEYQKGFSQTYPRVANDKLNNLNLLDIKVGEDGVVRELFDDVGNLLDDVGNLIDNILQGHRHKYNGDNKYRSNDGNGNDFVDDDYYNPYLGYEEGDNLDANYNGLFHEDIESLSNDHAFGFTTTVYIETGSKPSPIPEKPAISVNTNRGHPRVPVDENASNTRSLKNPDAFVKDVLHFVEDVIGDVLDITVNVGYRGSQNAPADVGVIADFNSEGDDRILIQEGLNDDKVQDQTTGNHIHIKSSHNVNEKGQRENNGNDHVFVKVNSGPTYPIGRALEQED